MSNYVIADGELYHYGVKGMRWGVITSVYTKRKLGGNYTDRQKKRMTSAAKKMLGRSEKFERYRAKAYTKAANKAYKKADKHVWTSEKAQAKGNQKKFEKYQGKAWKQLAKQHKALEDANQHAELAKVAAKRISNIGSGKLQAGRDFVTNHTYYTNLALDAVGLINVGHVRSLEFKGDNKR